jgi:hypothetical protein
MSQFSIRLIQFTFADTSLLHYFKTRRSTKWKVIMKSCHFSYSFEMQLCSHYTRRFNPIGLLDSTVPISNHIVVSRQTLLDELLTSLDFEDCLKKRSRSDLGSQLNFSMYFSSFAYPDKYFNRFSFPSTSVEMLNQSQYSTNQVCPGPTVDRGSL